MGLKEEISKIRAIQEKGELTFSRISSDSLTAFYRIGDLVFEMEMKVKVLVEESIEVSGKLQVSLRKVGSDNLSLFFRDTFYLDSRLGKDIDVFCSAFWFLFCHTWCIVYHCCPCHDTAFRIAPAQVPAIRSR